MEGGTCLIADHSRFILLTGEVDNTFQLQLCFCVYRTLVFSTFIRLNVRQPQRKIPQLLLIEQKRSSFVFSTLPPDRPGSVTTADAPQSNFAASGQTQNTSSTTKR